jgi:LPS-assembly lipoprotein
MSRLLLLLCLVLAVSACGFRPRGTLALAEELGPVKVQTADPYSELAQGLSVALARAGVKAAVEGEPSATLRVRSERLSTRPLTVDVRALVREYETLYRVGFDVIGADGKVRLPEQTVELTREFTYDAFAQAGSPAEQRLIEEELRREMQAAILRRLDAVLRAK